MRKIEGSKTDDIALLDLPQVIKEAKSKISGTQKFIEVVLYFHPCGKIVEKVNRAFSKAFGDKMVFVFVGSDWNHHSYQAAFADKSTFYVFLLASNYNNSAKDISKETLNKNIEKLKIISKATYLTLEDKSLLFRLAQ
jgi:fatty acid-binding protein DegV